MCNACEVLIGQAGLGGAPSDRGLEEYPSDWQEDLQRFSSILLELSDRYQDQVQIHIWDPRSFQGLLKAIRYGVRRYPTFIVATHQKFTGWDTEQLEQYLQSNLESANSAL